MFEFKTEHKNPWAEGGFVEKQVVSVAMPAWH